MPLMRNRPTGVAASKTQTKPKVGKDDPRTPNGVQQFDGRKNTNAGTDPNNTPWDLEGPSVLIKTPK